MDNPCEEVRKHCCLPTKVIEFIIYNCEQNNLSLTERYLTIDICKIFIHMLFFDVEEIHDKKSLTDKEWEDKWDKLSTGFCENLHLRIMSCIELATKMNSRKHHIKPKHIQAYLLKFGLHYTLETIVRSTYLVFKVIRFQVRK